MKNFSLVLVLFFATYTLSAMELPAINKTRANPPKIVFFSAMQLPSQKDANASCLLSWETEHTTTVKIEGIGIVPNSGDYEILECEHAPEFITLSADNEHGFGAEKARINTKETLGLIQPASIGGGKSRNTTIRTTPYYPRSYYPRGIYPRHVYPRRYY